MRAKRKVTLEEGEALVVFNMETWDYLKEAFLMLADQYEEGSIERGGWEIMAADIEYQTGQTVNPFEEEETW